MSAEKFAQPECETKPAHPQQDAQGERFSARPAPAIPQVRETPVTAADFGNYPYAQQAAAPELPPRERWLADRQRVANWWSTIPGLGLEAPKPAQYVVPRRFGMSAIFGIMTALAILFGWFHWSEAHPVLYLFFGVQSLIICLAQMLYGSAPRAASTAAGAIIMPVFLIAAAMLAGGRWGAGILCFLVFSVPVGAFLGYLTGTMAAGVFLVMDAAEGHLPWKRADGPEPAGSGEAHAP